MGINPGGRRFVGAGRGGDRGFDLHTDRVTHAFSDRAPLHTTRPPFTTLVALSYHIAVLLGSGRIALTIQARFTTLTSPHPIPNPGTGAAGVAHPNRE